jgi:cytochrome bd ubiquinol oxidase subunit II
VGVFPLPPAPPPRPTLVAFLAVLPIGGAILLPSLAYLYWTFRGEPDPEAGGEELRR